MRRTYKYNGIVVGVLLGLLIGLKTENVVLGVIAAIALSVVGVLAIQWIERLIEHGVDSAFQAGKNAYDKRKAEKAAQQNAIQNAQSGKKFCTKCGSELDGQATFCTKCGARQE